jgi:hypothetical protein
MSTREYFADVERRLFAIIDILGTGLSDAERNQVIEFIDVGEYGLALETIGEIFVESERTLPSKAYAEIMTLVSMMGLTSSLFAERLTQDRE